MPGSGSGGGTGGQGGPTVALPALCVSQRREGAEPALLPSGEGCCACHNRRTPCTPCATTAASESPGGFSRMRSLLSGLWGCRVRVLSWETPHLDFRSCLPGGPNAAQGPGVRSKALTQGALLINLISHLSISIYLGPSSCLLSSPCSKPCAGMGMSRAVFSCTGGTGALPAGG